MAVFSTLELPLVILFCAGILCLSIPSRYRSAIKALALAASLFGFLCGLYALFIVPPSSATGLFQYTVFGAATALGCSFFGAIIVLYSLKYADFIEQQNAYYGYILWSVSFSMFAVFSAHLLALLVFWGLSGLMLYLLANLVPQASNAAKKTFVFIGGSDSLMVLGVALLWLLTNSFDIYRIRIPLYQAPFPVLAAFLLLAVAALTKAGAMPFHTWIPDFAETVPLSLTAFLPAALDKLLGIFLLVLICNQLFVLTAPLIILLLIIGAVTVIGAVFMAMVQHDMRRLLSYHAVSQVGYMVLGIATGSPLGIAAGLFHMFNHAIYKSTLFLTAGAVEKATGTTSLDRLGGLSRFMPLTFLAAVIASLSISGVPPMNGFASKWMIYQSLLDQSRNVTAGRGLAAVSLVCLVVALFGSALTLASFMKMLHSVYLGQPSIQKPAASWCEARATMLVPMLVLAGLCILFGVVPFAVPLRYLVLPGLSTFGLSLSQVPGLWQSGTVAAFVAAGLLLGVVLYLVLSLRFRRDRAFTGGETPSPEARAAGTEFYTTISDMGFFKRIYYYAGRKYFDLYDQVSRLVLGAGAVLSAFHTGSLQTYLLMFLLGFSAILAVLFAAPR